MLKNKFISISLATLLLGLATTGVSASVLSIQSLPSYISTNNFKLSCTSNGGDVQFYVSKHGGAYTAFGSVIHTDTDQCSVQVTSSEINDETDYKFKANDVEQTSSTIYDKSAPSPVSGYYKERVNDGEHKLHWTNPGNTDFDKVIIYRGESADFPADSAHEIARVNGSPDSNMTYEDHFAPDANKNYFYDIRAVDHVGNSSSLVGDGGTTTSSTTTTTPTPKSSTGKVTVLPKESGSGSVLGTEVTATIAPEGTPVSEAATSAQTGNLFTWVMGHKKISLGVVLGLIVIGYLIYKSKKS